MVFLLSVCERERHKQEEHNQDKHKGERWDKEGGVKLGQKWMKNMSKNSVQ